MKKSTILVSLMIIVVLSLAGYAQYTGSDLERKRPENLYPGPGPGDLLIVDQLKTTNIQLAEQTRLLTEQNRILTDTLAQMKKQQQPPVMKGR